MFKRILLLILLLGGLFGTLYYFKTEQMKQSAAMLAHPRPPAVIATAKAVVEPWQPTLRSVGGLSAVNGIEVSPEVNGIVSELLFESGQTVRAGTPLLRLDANVDRAALTALRAEQRLAEVEFQRAKDLLKKKALSRSEFDSAEAQYRAAEARVAEQQAVVARKTIVAPFDGLLGIRQADLGQYLQSGDAIVALEALDPIHVDYTLPEREFGKLATGQTVRVELDAFPGETFEGTLTAIEAKVAEGSRSIGLQATLANADGRLRPGMFARVETVEGAPRPVVTVPRTAVSYNTYGDYVLVVTPSKDGGKDGKGLTIARRTVKSGAVREGRIEIVDGLKEGEEVVRTGQNKLRPGQPVTIDNSVQLDDAGVTLP
ncbi:efflux RND transporter periplasmic adaptor subunit [Endothiovibrio diazotrophicus]